MTGVDGAEAPEREPEAAVRVQAEGNVTRRIKLALKFHRSGETKEPFLIEQRVFDTNVGKQLS